jgi:hypothetical protein
MAKALAVLLFMASFASPQSNMKEVVYQLDGSSKYVNFTMTSESGGKEQSTVKLPFERYRSAAKANLAVMPVFRVG